MKILGEGFDDGLIGSSFSRWFLDGNDVMSRRDSLDVFLFLLWLGGDGDMHTNLLGKFS